MISLCHDDLYNYRSHPLNSNNQNINLNKITCLNIYNKLESHIRNSSCMISKYSIFFRVHISISMYLSIFKSKSVDKIIIEEIFKYTLLIFKSGFFSKILPFNYRLAIIYFFIRLKICKIFMKGN